MTIPKALIINDYMYYGAVVEAIDTVAYEIPFGRVSPAEGLASAQQHVIVRVADGKLEKLIIFGNDYPTPDGTCQRDYLHVVDLAVGHVKALEYSANNVGAEAINLGIGNGISVTELVNAFETVNGLKQNYVYGPRLLGRCHQS